VQPRGRPDENALYRAYSTVADEVIDADKLCDADELGRLRHLRIQEEGQYDCRGADPAAVRGESVKF